MNFLDLETHLARKITPLLLTSPELKLLSFHLEL